MRTIHSDILQFRGSHYDFGLLQGQLLKGSVTLENRRKQWKTKGPRFEIDVTDTKAAFLKFAPKIWEEIEGLRDALELPMEEVLRDFGGYRITPEPSGCSILTGEGFLLRNYDFHPQTYEGRYMLYQPSDGGYATIGPSQRILGRMDGMNDQGLAMGYNFIHRKKPGEGFVCYMIGRIILETCATVDEAIVLLEEIPHRGSFSYVVKDRTGKSRIIEATPRKTIVREAAACTNHFEVQHDENRHYLKDSFERMEAIESQTEDGTELLQAYRLFNDPGRGVFAHDYRSWAGTIHTSAYLPEKQEAWIAIGGNAEPAVFDFAEWVKGEKENRTSLNGEIDTTLGFGYLDKLHV